jgi:hypothetical protein
MVIFSKSIIEEYKSEMASAYGIFVNDSDAQIQLKRLVNTMFPTISVDEPGVSKGFSPLAPAHGEVGASITPTSGQINY